VPDDTLYHDTLKVSFGLMSRLFKRLTVF